MTKPPLFQQDSYLEEQLIETLQAGLKQWRPDLNFPESYSDMQACVRGLLSMFEVKRRPIAAPLRYHCDRCEGIGKLIDPKSTASVRDCTHCSDCRGRGYIVS